MVKSVFLSQSDILSWFDGVRIQPPTGTLIDTGPPDSYGAGASAGDYWTMGPQPEYSHSESVCEIDKASGCSKVKRFGARLFWGGFLSHHGG